MGGKEVKFFKVTCAQCIDLERIYEGLRKDLEILLQFLLFGFSLINIYELCKGL